MLSRVTANRYHDTVRSGRTKPCFLGCIQADGTEVELIVKLRGSEMTVRSQITEAVTALLAADLDLPVPEPFLVNIEADFAATIPNPPMRTRAQQSLGWNFGSKKLPPGFATIPTDKPIPQALVQTAGEILAFDVFVCNPDRTVANPNCLTNGRELAIYDHELAFRMDGILGWVPPWETGGITFPKGQPPRLRHVFQEQLRGVPLDLERLAGAFEVVTPTRLQEYREALPAEWGRNGKDLDNILDYILKLRDNVSISIANLKGVLR